MTITITIAQTIFLRGDDFGLISGVDAGVVVGSIEFTKYEILRTYELEHKLS